MTTPLAISLTLHIPALWCAWRMWRPTRPRYRGRHVAVNP